MENLKNELLKIKYIKSVDYDTSDTKEMGVLITIININYEELEKLKTIEYFEEKKKLKKDIYNLYLKNNIDFQIEEFEDNETYLYIVSYNVEV